MNKYQQTTQKKKSAILKACLTLFKENGVGAVSMKHIATSAGVSQASIYNYFGSKEGVVAACMDIVMEETFQKAREILMKDMSFLDKLESALSLCSEGLNQSISQYFTQNALQDKSLLNLLTENINRGKRALYRQYIEYGKNEGAIDSSIPTEIYLGYVEAINSMETNIDYSDNTEESMEYIHRLFLYGLMGRMNT